MKVSSNKQTRARVVACLGASVVSVLSHLGDEDAGAAAVVLSEGVHLGTNACCVMGKEGLVVVLCCDGRGRTLVSVSSISFWKKSFWDKNVQYQSLNECKSTQLPTIPHSSLITHSSQGTAR